LDSAGADSDEAGNLTDADTVVEQLFCSFPCLDIDTLSVAFIIEVRHPGSTADTASESISRVNGDRPHPLFEVFSAFGVWAELVADRVGEVAHDDGWVKGTLENKNGRFWCLSARGGLSIFGFAFRYAYAHLEFN
jgi:hypothetical protein